MANKNKKVDDVISEDDDPTAELEVLSLPASDPVESPDTVISSGEQDAERESDAATYGFAKDGDATIVQGKSIPELQSDLDTRSKTIGRLQHDIEQLRSKWLGLEAEIGAREEIVTDLSREVDELNNQVALKDRVLKKRDDKIESLKSQLRERDEARTLLEQQQAELEQKLSEQRSARADKAAALDQSKKELAEFAARLETTAEEQESLQSEIAQLGDAHGSLEKDRSDLAQQLEEVSGALQKAEQDLEDTRARLKTAEDRNASDKLEIEQRVDAYEQLERKHAELEGRLEEASSTRKELERDLEETRATLAASQEEASSLVAEVDNRNDAYAKLEQARLQLEQHLSETKQTLKSVTGDLEVTRDDLETARADIATLEAEIGQRDAAHEALGKEQADLQRRFDETTATLEEARREVESMNEALRAEQEDAAAKLDLAHQTAAADVKAINLQLAGAEKYADTLRYKLQEFTDSESQWRNEHERLSESIDEINRRNKQLSEDIEAADETIAALKGTIEQQQSEHEQEIRTLRLELGEAQETATQAAGLNDELTSNLVDTRNTKVDVERMLREKETESREQIAELTKEVDRLTRGREELEQKLLTKSEAINTLLGELAKKTAQLESIGDVEEVIQDIDSRMSDRIDEPRKEARPRPDKESSTHDRDKTTRVLIGSFGDRELRFPLFKKRLTIGRVEDNDIQVKTSYISRRHAVILNESNTARIIDSNSKNGVFVNSKRVKEHSLTNGDKVSIGNVKFRYEERPKRDA